MRTIVSILTAIILATGVSAADFGGRKYYINPGHGGHDSNDRPTPMPLGVEIFYESDGNLSRGLHLRDFLTANNAQVKMSRVTNTSADDLNLTTIASQSNSYGGYFMSLHTNGANASANYIISFYRSSASAQNTETIAGSKSMTQASVDWHNTCHLTNFTANGRASGDYAFYGYNLGVLRTNNRPGYLVETTFHDYRPDGLRLKSEVFNRFTAWQLARAALANSGGSAGGTGTLSGCIIGDIRDIAKPCGYTEYTSRGRDRYLAINNATVNLYDRAGTKVQSMTTDNCCNGVYGFFNLADGTYTIEVIKSGYATKRHTVTVTANNITRQLVDLTVGPPPIELQAGWNFSENAGKKPAWLADDWLTLRNMCYGDGKLYVTSPSTSKVYILDASTCELIRMLDMTGVSGGTFPLMDVKYVDGKLIGCNLAAKADEPIKVYVWDTDNSRPRCILNTTSRGGMARIGDTFDIDGTLDDGRLIFAFGGDNNHSSHIVTYALNNQVADSNPVLYKVTTAAGAAVKLGVSPRAVAETNHRYWLTGHSLAPALTAMDGTIDKTINSNAMDGIITGNDFKRFMFNGKHYCVATTYTPPAQAPGGKSHTGGKLVLMERTTDWNACELIGRYPSAGLGSTPNDYFSTSVCINTDGIRYIEAWVLVTRQGLAYFKLGTPPESSGVDNITADSEPQLDVRVTGNGIIVDSPTPLSHVALYSTAGTLIAQQRGNELTVSLPRGIYILVATDHTGRPTSLKVSLN